MEDLISKRTRLNFREYFVGLVLRDIDIEFGSADIPCDIDFVSNESGQRRSRVEQYYHSLNFSDPKDVKKLLKVFESVLCKLENQIRAYGSGYQDFDQKKFDALQNDLRRDGYVFAFGELIRVGTHHQDKKLEEAAVLISADYLKDQIKRMHVSVETDPGLAIGTAKELVETVCKTILNDKGVPMREDWDLNRLVKETRGILKLVPEDVPESAKGADIIKKMLSNLGQVSQGLAELRNLYGSGHGKDGRSKGLSSRHARLAVQAASALSTFLFDTHTYLQSEK